MGETVMRHATEGGLRVVYYTAEDGTVHRYEETAERDADGLAVFAYTGLVDPPEYS